MLYDHWKVVHRCIIPAPLALATLKKHPAREITVVKENAIYYSAG